MESVLKPHDSEVPVAQVILVWIVWLVAAVANAFVVFLFVVFGLAASAGAPVEEFKWATAIAVFVSYAASLYFMFKGRIVIGILLLAIWLPLLMGYGLLFAEGATK
jgi:hypothetical protein